MKNGGNGLFSERENLLNINLVQYKNTLQMSWEELFSGFDRLYAVTYSSSISFVSKVVPLFKEVEIIFGYERILRDFESIMAYQEAAIESLKEHFGEKQKELLSRIDDNTLKVYLLRDRISHKKLFLMESDAGKRRVVTGSANLSGAAFSGFQLENIITLEDEPGYNCFFDDYLALRNGSVDYVPKNVIVDADENAIENIPIMRTAKEQKTVVVVLRPDNSEENRKAENYRLRVDNLVKKYVETAPRPNKQGKIILSGDSIVKLARQYRSRPVHEDSEEKQPEFVVDVYEKRAHLDGKPFDLTPSPEEIRHDVDLFLKYMDGFNQFKGNVEGLMTTYYAFASWFFASPFIYAYRNRALQSMKSVYLYPAHGILFGKSNAGKSDFLRTLMTMMYGYSKMLPAGDFTKSLIRSVRESFKHFPIVVDDINRTRFTQHAVELIKDDGLASDRCPTIVFSANTDLDALDSEITKRVVSCFIDASIDRKTGARSSLVKSTQDRIKTNLYREYLRRMLDAVPDLLDNIETNQPDLLAVSSEVLYQLLEEYTDGRLPSWVRVLPWDYYVDLGDRNVKGYINELWLSNPDWFTVNERRNELILRITKDNQLINRLKKNTPDYVYKSSAGDMIIFYLNYSREYFDNEFRKKKGFLSWVKRN